MQAAFIFDHLISDTGDIVREALHGARCFAFAQLKCQLGGHGAGRDEAEVCIEEIPSGVSSGEIEPHDACIDERRVVGSTFAAILTDRMHRLAIKAELFEAVRAEQVPSDAFELLREGDDGWRRLVRGVHWR